VIAGLVAEPAAQPLQASHIPAADLAIVGTAQMLAVPTPSTSGAQRGLTTLPESVQSPWLYQAAGRITAAAADADIDDCVHVEGYYSESTGMQLQRTDSVLHPDSSADVVSRRLPVIPHNRFIRMRIGDVDFHRARTVRYHVQPGELAFIISSPLPQDEQQLMSAILAAYAPGRFAAQGMTPVNVFDAIVSTAYQQVPRQQTRAATLRLLARLPEVHIEPQAQDPLLRITIAATVSVAGSDRTLYFSPDTGQLLAYTEIIRSGYTPRGTKPPHLREAVLFQTGCPTADLHTVRSPSARLTRHPRASAADPWWSA
jgi:hypothetical protein